MNKFNSNILLGVFAGIFIILLIYYLNKDDDQPIHNEGTVDLAASLAHGSQTSFMPVSSYRPANPPMVENRKPDDISNSIVDDLVAQYTVEDRPMEGGTGSFSPNDPLSETHGSFSGYGKKRQLNMKKTEEPYAEDTYDPRDFSYKKKKFSKRTPADVRDQFDISKMLPQVVEEDWFDVE